MKWTKTIISLCIGLILLVSTVSAETQADRVEDQIHTLSEISNNINNIDDVDTSEIPGNNYYMTDSGEVYTQVSEHIYYNEDSRIIDSIPIEHEPYMVRYNDMEFTF